MKWLLKNQEKMQRNQINTNETQLIRLMSFFVSLILSLVLLPITNNILGISLLIICTLIFNLIIYNVLLKNVIGYFLPKHLAHRLFGCHVGFWKYLHGDFNIIKQGYWNEIEKDTNTIPIDQRDHILMYTHQCTVCSRLWDETHGGISS